MDAARRGFALVEAAVRAVDSGQVEGEALEVWVGLAKRLRDAGGVGKASQDMTLARQAFYDLSTSALDLVRRLGHAEGTLHEAFCPMARNDQGASWLQEGEVINNPYFGSQMLRCGEVREAFRGLSQPGGGEKEGR